MPFKFKIKGFEKLWTIFDILIHEDTEKLNQEMDRNNFTLQPQFLKPLSGEKVYADLPDTITMSILSRYHQEIEFELKDF